MRSTLARYTRDTEFGARTGRILLLLILVVAGVSSVLSAIAKPLWFDEIITIIICRLPSAAAVSEALNNAADTNPAPFYLVTRWFSPLVSDDHLGYRIPAILGFLGTILCVYSILSKRLKPLSALIGASFILCTPLVDYAFEARPYSLQMFFIAAAVLSWQRIDDSRWWSLGVAAALGAAVSMHYYAIFVFPAFGVAELSVWLFRRRFRAAAWAALIAGTLPFLFAFKTLLNLQQHYGQHFWAQPHLWQISRMLDWYFGFAGHWGLSFAVGVTALMLCFAITRFIPSTDGLDRPSPNSIPLEEQALVLILLWLPVMTVVAAKLSHGGMSDRYAMASIIGGALALGYVIDRIPSTGRVFLLTLLLLTYSASALGPVRKALSGSLLRERTAMTDEVKAILAQGEKYGLPVAISGGLRYLPMVYYTPPGSVAKLHMMIDAEAAIKYYGSDSLDGVVLELRKYSPLPIEDFAEFVSKHPEFLLVSVGDAFDWWPARLVDDGYRLSLVSTIEMDKVYKVTRGPNW